MPSINQLKAIKKLMQEKGLLTQLQKEIPSVAEKVFAQNKEKADLIRNARKQRELGDFQKNSSKIKNLNEIINYRSEFPTEPRSLTAVDREVDENAASALRAAKNYPSQNLEENEKFRNLLESYKNYEDPYFNFEEAPDVWTDHIRSKVMDKWDQVKSAIKKNKSSK